NQHWVDYTGMTLEESYGDGWTAPFHPDDLQRSQEAWRQAAATGGIYEVEVRLRSADGAYRWWLIRGVPMHDAEGETVKWFGTCTDIEDLMQAALALEVSAGRLAAGAEQGRSIAWEVDADGLYTYVSPVIETVLGYSPDEVTGLLHFWDLRAEDGREAFRTAVFEVFANEGTVQDLGSAVQAKGGRRLWLSTNGAPVLDDGGAVRGYRGSDTDFTERHQIEEIRGEDLERVRRALASIVEIVGQVSEARDPYTAGHQRRVSELAVRISQEMGMSAARIEEIRIAALIHDVGKMSVPTEILSKSGGLSAVEFQLIKVHAEAGYRIISSAHMEGPIADIVRQHHERCDGSGYPRGLGADKILPASKILMVADVVEAMMSYRPYRAALGMEAALAEIEGGAGTLYDADVCRACVTVFRERHFELSPQAA
ncbi:MAG TPA: HD domain-containing phosphohydrolase, partial [Coriobacteriia bacterium]